MSDELARALADAGGFAAGREHTAALRRLLVAELERGADELRLPRSGYGAPVTVVVVPGDDALLGIAPVAAGLRADPEAAGERTWLMLVALVGALVQAAGLPAPVGPEDLALRAGAAGEHLALAVPAAEPEEAAELAIIAFDEGVANIDRLRARALALPGHAPPPPTDLRAPIGDTHPLRVAEAIARFGGQPADDASVADHEEAVLNMLQPAEVVAAPHADPDPARRAARRILQRLDGMGKWGGYHTEFRHLARGFAGNEAALALDVGERLLAAGLLESKPSVGQRHVYLNPRRVADIRALVDRGEVPRGLSLH